MMSPDGKLLYFFADDVLIYDTTEFKQVDKWELSRPLEEGLGRFDFGPRDVTYEEPGFYSGIFTDAGSGAEPPHHGRSRA